MRMQTIALLVSVALSGGCKVIEDSDAGREGHAREQRIDVNALPLNVTAAVKGAMPNGTITEAEKEMYKGKLVYSLDVRDAGKEYDVIVTPDGQILSSKVDPNVKP
jgi:hypothetical protein